jgi:hypothetical protein
MEYLNDIEKNELAKLNENPTLMNAIKKVILSVIYYRGTMFPGQASEDPLENPILFMAAHAIQDTPHITDDMLGRNLRADTQALRQLELAFKELYKFKIVQPIDGEKNNPGR